MMIEYRQGFSTLTFGVLAKQNKVEFGDLIVKARYATLEKEWSKVRYYCNHLRTENH